MTANPETRFVCNRCGIDDTVPIQNTPMHSRMAGPEGWLCLTIGNEPGTPNSHLCGTCGVAFDVFMKSGTPVSTRAQGTDKDKTS